ncbi:restriction endonuclease [bacterium LRH843]|nr:restriction endonuclease [bacterium LRH843]
MDSELNKIQTRKRQYPFLPIILFTVTYILVQFYHYSYTLFGLSVAFILSAAGIWYVIKAIKVGLQVQTITGIIDVDEMTDKEFQLFLLQLFQQQGYTINHPKSNSTDANRLFLKTNGIETVVYVIREGLAINEQTIHKALQVKKNHGQEKAIIITNSTFTKEAQLAANANKINLIDRESLDAMIDAYVRPNREYKFFQQVRTLFVKHEANS